MLNLSSTPVLVIDDEELIRNDIEEILVPRLRNAAMKIHAAAAVLSNADGETGAVKSSVIPAFTVDKASNGRDGINLVAKAMEAGQPYKVIFLDVRMPGLDGLETALEIRKYDRFAEIIFITAFSDRSIEDILSQAGENVGYHCKPYMPDEIIVLATHAAAEYNRVKEMEKLITAITGLAGHYKPDGLLNNVLTHLAAMTSAHNALLLKKPDNPGYEHLTSLNATTEDFIAELIAKLEKVAISDDITTLDTMLCLQIKHYVAVLIMQDKPELRTNTRYHLQLFMRHAEQAIRNAELQEALVLREKLSAVGKAIAMVTHDLRTPVKSLQVLVDIIRKENNYSDWIDMLGRYADQASEIFDDFMDFIRDTPIHKIPVNLFQIVNEIADHIRQEHAFITVHMFIPENLMILGDRGKLKRILFNLMNNAAEMLRIKEISPAVVEVAVLAAGKNDEIEIIVRDNGPGIPAGLLPSIFDPFVTSGKKNGTGLGLAIVKQYVSAHQATIEVNNANGAVFTIKGINIAV